MTAVPSPADLDRWEALAAAATTGWYASGIDVFRDRGAFLGQNDIPLTEADAAFIAEARQAVPVLVAALRDALAENAELRMRVTVLEDEARIHPLAAALRDALAEVEGQTLVARSYEQERDAARSRLVDATAQIKRMSEDVATQKFRLRESQTERDALSGEVEHWKVRAAANEEIDRRAGMLAGVQRERDDACAALDRVRATCARAEAHGTPVIATATVLCAIEGES